MEIVVREGYYSPRCVLMSWASCRMAIVGVEVVVERLWCVVVTDDIPPVKRALYLWL